MSAAPWFTISAQRFRDNIAAVQRRLAPGTLMLVMKDDAYGHDLDWAVAEAAEVSWFGGYDVSTGLRIRASRPDARVFSWATSVEDEVDAAIAADLDLGVGTMPYLRLVIDRAQAVQRSVHVHLKIDTGLHRNGVRPEHWAEFVEHAMAAQRAGVIEVVGIWSHLSEASDDDDDDSAAIFRASAASLRAAGARLEVEHLTASAASWWRPELRGNLSRIGAFCYGIRSAEGPQIPGVAPVATLSATVLRVDGAEAEVGIGALHGLPSTLVGASVGTASGSCTIRAIDAHTLTIDAREGLRVGDEVRIFGPGGFGEPDATALGERIDSIGEEIMLRISPRVRRVHVQ